MYERVQAAQNWSDKVQYGPRWSKIVIWICVPEISERYFFLGHHHYYQPTSQVVVRDLEEMEEHMAALHPKIGGFWCDQCNYSFLGEEALKSHNKKYHASQGAKKRRYGPTEARS